MEIEQILTLDGEHTKVGLDGVTRIVYAEERPAYYEIYKGDNRVAGNGADRVWSCV